jgi:hypothetical protein
VDVPDVRAGIDPVVTRSWDGRWGFGAHVVILGGAA